jgi:opacity protein-like surface antigen
MQIIKKQGDVMKKAVLVIGYVAAMGSLVFAGGDMTTTKEVEPAVVLPVAIEEPAAENGWYAGLGLSAVSTREANVSVEFTGGKTGQDRLGNITLLAGYNFNAYLAAEGRYTTSISYEDNVEMSGWSLFLKPQYPVTEEFAVYALLGFGGVTLDGVDGANIDVDETGFQWGIGMNYLIMEHVSLFTDYTFLGNDMDGIYNGASKADVDAITVGMTYDF